MTDNQDAEKFFYAFSEQDAYDDTIDLVVPEYRLLHSNLLHLLISTIPKSDNPVTVLDIGSGTGTETIAVLKSIPGVYVHSLDISQEMLALLSENITQADHNNDDLSVRSTLLQADIRHADLTTTSYSAVISAFTIHHFSHDEKQAIFNKCFAALVPGGVFINLDLYNFANPTISTLALDYDIRWISTQFDEPENRFAKALQVPKRKRSQLRDEWVRHYLHDNICEPIESSAEIEGQEAMLRRSGFAEVSVPVRLWQSAILWGRKATD